MDYHRLLYKKNYKSFFVYPGHLVEEKINMAGSLTKPVRAWTSEISTNHLPEEVWNTVCDELCFDDFLTVVNKVEKVVRKHTDR